MLEVKLEGTRELQELLIKLGKDLESNSELNEELSSNLAQKASSIAPRLTGSLASSIVGNPSPQKAQIVAGSGAVPYAGVIEYGWPAKNIQAQPYLNKTVNSNMGYIIERYNQSIEDNIKKYNLN
jgi:hypothetical protein